MRCSLCWRCPSHRRPRRSRRTSAAVGAPACGLQRRPHRASGSLFCWGSTTCPRCSIPSPALTTLRPRSARSSAKAWSPRSSRSRYEPLPRASTQGVPSPRSSFASRPRRRRRRRVSAECREGRRRSGWDGPPEQAIAPGRWIPPESRQRVPGSPSAPHPHHVRCQTLMGGSLGHYPPDPGGLPQVIPAGRERGWAAVGSAIFAGFVTQAPRLGTWPRSKLDPAKVSPRGNLATGSTRRRRNGGRSVRALLAPANTRPARRPQRDRELQPGPGRYAVQPPGSMNA